MNWRLIACLTLAASLFGCGLEYEVCTTHYPSGEVWSVRYYSNGVPHRPWVTWHSNEIERQTTNFEQGARAGDWRTVSVDGRILFERSYLDDEPHGTWRRYHRNGKTASESSFDQGRPVGVWTWWDRDGNVTATLDYD
ncbi:MAG: toxin-antitoxin system YwqK family antitoxin [Planctomycetota bacterium]|jgi:antitoxin component YwqK of YwqJK toxin-antitoxin module